MKHGVSGQACSVSSTKGVQNEISVLDKLMTIRAAAEALGLPYHKVQRATARKLVPTYSLGDSKKYVRLRGILGRLESPSI